MLLGGEGGRRLLEVGEEESEVLLVAVGGSAGEAFVEEAAEGVEVGAAVDRVAADLLGRDVVDRAGELGFQGQELRLGEAAGEAEVGEVDVLGRPAVSDSARRTLDGLTSRWTRPRA